MLYPATLSSEKKKSSVFFQSGCVLYRGDGMERGEDPALNVLPALQDYFFLRRGEGGWGGWEGGRERIIMHVHQTQSLRFRV
jgi:hypothetical protein